MATAYSNLLLYTFRRFSVVKALRTGPETLWHYARRTPLPKSEKPALFTMNILPPMMTVWYHFMQKHVGDAVDTVIFDCSGSLDKSMFPKARVQKFLNFYAATKSDEFLYHIAKNRKIGWICDDDMFILNSKAADLVTESLRKPNTASFSFRPRTWWHFDIDGKTYQPSSSYCTAINREIVMEKEQLSLSPCDGNSHVSHIGKPLKRFDTFDKANETLLKKGYECEILDEDLQEQYVTGFSGMSSSVMLLWYFKTKQQTLDYLLTPEKKYWSGNALFTILSGLLAISSIFEMHEKITGKPYHMPSMPKKDDLLRIREEHEHLLREDLSFERVDTVSARLMNAL